MHDKFHPGEARNSKKKTGGARRSQEEPRRVQEARAQTSSGRALGPPGQLRNEPWGHKDNSENCLGATRTIQKKALGPPGQLRNKPWGHQDNSEKGLGATRTTQEEPRRVQEEPRRVQEEPWVDQDNSEMSLGATRTIQKKALGPPGQFRKRPWASGCMQRRPTYCLGCP